MVPLMSMRLESLVQIHLRLKVLMPGAAIKEPMILPVVVVIVHGVGVMGGGVRARGAIWRWGVVERVEQSSCVANGRAAAVVEAIALMYRGAVLLEEILRSAIEAAETIGHYQASTVSGCLRLLPARRRGGGAAAAAVVKECARGWCLGRRGIWLAHSSSSPAHEKPAPLCMNESIRPFPVGVLRTAELVTGPAK